MTDFTVSHIIIGRKANSTAVCLDRLPGAVSLEPVKGRGVCSQHHIAEGFRGFTDTVHDDQYDRFAHDFVSSVSV